MTFFRPLALTALFAATLAPAQAQVTTTYHYGVKFVCGIERKALDAYVTLGRYLTEVNIGNPHDKPIDIRKYVNLLLIKDDKAVREPELAKPEGDVGLPMDPFTATSDDCAAIGKMIGIANLGTGPVTIGFLNIISREELNVTAVHTTQSLKPTTAEVPGIAVEKIWPVKIGQ